MQFTRKWISFLWLFTFLLVFSAQVIPRIMNESPTNDEPLDLTGGYFYWKGDVVSCKFHPPFSKMLQCLPLRFLPVKDDSGPGPPPFEFQSYRFVFLLNHDRFEWMTRVGRLVTLCFGLAIGGVLFFLTRRETAIIRFTVMTLWVFEPTLLAFSGLVMEEIPATFLFLISVLAFKKCLENDGFFWRSSVGITSAFAVCSKFSALILVPVFVLLEALDYIRLKKSNNLPKIYGWKTAKDWFWGAFVFFTVIFLLYLPGTFHEPDHLFPLAYFFDALKTIFQYSHFQHPTYFLGQASRESHWLYFPVAFLLKSTIPFLVLVFLAIGMGLKKKLHLPPWMWVPPILFFLSIIPGLNTGVRYLLPAYPFLILMASRMAGQLWTGWNSVWGRSGKLALGGLLLWHATSVLANAPNMISYYNDLIPQEKKIYYLGDSNLDFGQDVKRLAQVGQERGWKNVKLAQFDGMSDPSLYGLSWSPWTERDLLKPQPGFVYAINLNLIQLGPVFFPDFYPIAKSWVLNIPPTGRVGDTWLYFEIPGKPEPDSSPPLHSVRL